MRIVNVCGARPNFMKIAPLLVITDLRAEHPCATPTIGDKLHSNAP